MSEPTQTEARASRELFATFVGRMAKGLGARIESEAEVSAPEDFLVAPDSFPSGFPGGALMARTAWTADDRERSGCFLWAGNVGALLGEEEKAPTDVTDAEIETLGQSLRIGLEESEEGDLAFEWTNLERVSAEAAADALREAGISGAVTGDRFTVRVGQAELTFVFLEAGAEPAADDGTPVAEDDPATSPAVSGPTEVKVDTVPIEPAGPPDPHQLDNVLEVPLSLTIRLGSTEMTLDEVLRLLPGSVVELDQREEEPLEVLANGRVIARGEVVVVDERFGLRVTEIVKSEDRLAATS